MNELHELVPDNFSNCVLCETTAGRTAYRILCATWDPERFANENTWPIVLIALKNCWIEIVNKIQEFLKSFVTGGKGPGSGCSLRVRDRLRTNSKRSTVKITASVFSDRKGKEFVFIDFSPRALLQSDTAKP